MKNTLFVTILMMAWYGIANGQNQIPQRENRPGMSTPMQEFEKIKPELNLSAKQEKKLQKLYTNRQKQFEQMHPMANGDRSGQPDMNRGEGRRPPQGENGERPSGPPPSMNGGDHQGPPPNGPGNNKQNPNSAYEPDQSEKIQAREEKFETRVRKILNEKQFEQWQNIRADHKPGNK